jgi:hypothetical protein
VDPNRVPPPVMPAYPRPDYTQIRKQMQRAQWSRKKRFTMFMGRASWRGMRLGVRTGFRYRNKLWPLFAGGGMFATSLALNLLSRPEDGGPDAIGDGWKTALVLSVLAGLVLGWKQRTAAKRAEQWLRRSMLVSWVVWAASCAWTTTAAALNPFTTPLPGLLITAAIGLEAWWFIHQTLRENDHEIEVEIEEYEERVLDKRVEKWVLNIARDGGALPAAELHGMNDLEDNLGWQATIQLPPDDAQTVQSAIAATRRIAKVYGVPATQVVVEPNVNALEDSARLLVLTRNPLSAVQPFVKPQLDHATGLIPIGAHADGSRALWRLWTPGSGACHGLIAGTTGSGKGGVVNVLCAEIRHSGIAALFFGDPQGGESAPDWVDGAHCFAGTIPRIRRMLQGVEREMKAREKRRSRSRWTDEKGRTRRGKGKYDPTPEEPLLMVVIDEAWQVTPDPECRRIIALIGKVGRKLGVGIVLAVQVPSLAELGGDLTIRSMLSSTNIVILRTSDKLSVQMGVPMDLPVDPVNLPVEWPDGSTTAGLGYLCQAGGRVSPMRGFFLEDAYDWATSGEPVVLSPELIASFVDEFGNYLLDWRDLLDVDDDEQAECERIVADSYDVQEPPKTKERIVAFLAARHERGEPAVRFGVIADKLNLTKPATSNALRRMAKDGVVRQPENGHGMWCLAEQSEVLGDELVAASA